MDMRIHQITAWYNPTLARHNKDKAEFNRRFGNDQTIDLSDPEVARGYGRLEKESEILDDLGRILQNDVTIVDVPDDTSAIDTDPPALD